MPPSPGRASVTRLLLAVWLKKRPGLLEKRVDVRFALKCQEFIELVKKGELTAAVALAQVRTPHGEVSYTPHAPHDE